MAIERKRIEGLDLLRGLAALAVCWFHFTNALPTPHLPSWMVLSGRPGWHGVEVFFVLSGFVIPYSLHRSRYRIRDYGKFVLKRLMRLHLPYLASIVVILALGFWTHWALGFPEKALSLSGQDLLLHLGYLNGLFGVPWINSVYWTLAIEFQYYLLIGLLFPWLAAIGSWKPEAALFGLGVLALAFPREVFVFHYLFPFLLGVAVFRYRIGMAGPIWHSLTLLVLGAGCWYTLKGTSMAVSLATALLIAHGQFGGSRPLRHLGDISYSFYLLHFPVGLLTVQLLARFMETPSGAVAVGFLAVAAAIGVAAVFHAAVEKPSLKWAAAIGSWPRVAG